MNGEGAEFESPARGLSNDWSDVLLLEVRSTFNGSIERTIIIE